MAPSSSPSSRVGQSASGTVSVRGPSTTLTASPRRSVTGVAVTPSATSFRQPAPSARARSSSMTWSVRAGSPPAPAADGAGRPPRASSSSATSGASVGSARATAASPACHSSPCGPCHGRAQTTCPRAMYVARRVPPCSPGVTTQTASPRKRSMRCSSRTTCSSASIRSRSRAASSNRSSCESRRSLARRRGNASSTASHSTPCRARAASCARRLLLSGPSGPGVDEQTTLSPRRRR